MGWQPVVHSPGVPGARAWQARTVGWDERLFDLLDDLEGQAEALYAVEREAELADRSRAEYAAVTLASRLMASAGDEVALDLAGVGRVAGALQRIGTGWCLVRADGSDWLVLLDAVVSVDGRLGPLGAGGRVVAAGEAGAGRDAPPAGRRGRAERGAHP